MPPVMTSGMRCNLTVSVAKETRLHMSIIFGDVFFFAGQSNMQYRMELVANVSSELKKGSTKARQGWKGG